MDLDTKAKILAQMDVTAKLIWEGSPEPFKNRYRHIAFEHPNLPIYGAIADASAKYRAEEQSKTPRLIRGKYLHELGVRLDEALEIKPSQY